MEPAEAAVQLLEELSASLTLGRTVLSEIADTLAAIRDGSQRWVENRIDVAQPAAGANATIPATQLRSVPAVVVAAKATLVTDANVANRFLSVQYLDSESKVRDESGAAVFATASGTQQYRGHLGQTVGEWNTAGTDLTPAIFGLSRMVLLPGDQVKFNVVNIQAGDQLSGLALVAVEPL